MVCRDVHSASASRLSQTGKGGGHSDVDELLDAPGCPVIVWVEDLYTLHGDLVAWPLIKVQVLYDTIGDIQLDRWYSWAHVPVSST